MMPKRKSAEVAAVGAILVLGVLISLAIRGQQPGKEHTRASGSTTVSPTRERAEKTEQASRPAAPTAVTPESGSEFDVRKSPVTDVETRRSVPSPTDMGAKLEVYWGESRLSELKDYIKSVRAKDPGYIPALVADSFVDFIFEGELESALRKQVAVDEALDEATRLEHPLFAGMLRTNIRFLKKEMSMHVERGTTPAMLRANANPRRYREMVGRALPRRLVLVGLAPIVSLSDEVAEELGE